MSWLATQVIATVGSAVIGGIATNKASKRAAQGQKEALKASTAATSLARRDVTKAFEGARESRRRGFENALSLLSGSAERQIAPFQKGNIQAQAQIARGLPQIQNAILGQPTDLSGFTPRSVGAPSSFNIDPSQFRAEPTEPVIPEGYMSPEQVQQLVESLTSGGRFF
jgi:hypothetical protein